MVWYLLILCQGWVLVFSLGLVAQHAAWCVLRHPLVTCVWDIGQVIVGSSFSWVTSGCVRASFWILILLLLWLYNKSSHVIFNILLHQKIIIIAIINHFILIISLHNFIHSVVIIEVDAASLFLWHVVRVVIWCQLFAMFFEEQLQLLINLILRQSLQSLTTRRSLPSLWFLL